MASKKSLADLQAWFGGAISQPLPDVYPGNPLAVSKPDLEAEADLLLKSKGGLSGFSRLGIYNQQYWFRLVSIMQSEYPCAVHLMGLAAFNHAAIRFLTAHPPASPYLAELDAGFSAFMVDHFPGEDFPVHSQVNPEAVHQAIAYDRAFSRAFDAPAGRLLTSVAGGDAGEAMAKPLRLAPHATLLRLDFDFAAYRSLCRGDASLEAVFPLAAKTALLVLYRSRELEIAAYPLTDTAMRLLQEFQQAALVGEVFANLEGRLSPAEEAELAAHLAAWFQDWVAKGLLVSGED